eukprot:TRINITY_DN674_c0_g2_i1.p1 TRINITY_DN674_c0_g2~~TRINITY_DN674_c0_g2_i1.p1  ORF type:complete len:711 (-),score=124.31 TRINITY_DN674_c0_g2_i1:213-2345(-)
MPPKRGGPPIPTQDRYQYAGRQRRDYGSQDGDSRAYYRQNSRGRGRGRRGRGRDGRGRGGYFDPEGKHMRVVNPEPPEVVTSDVSAALLGLSPGSRKPPSRSSSASKLQVLAGYGRGSGYDSGEMHRSHSYNRPYNNKYNNSYKQQRHMQQQQQYYTSNEPAQTNQHLQQSPPGDIQGNEQFTNEPHFVQQVGEQFKQEEIDREYVKDKDSAGGVDSNMVTDVVVDAQTTYMADSSADEEQVEYEDEEVDDLDGRGQEEEEEEEESIQQGGDGQVTDPIVKMWLQHVNDDNQIDSLKSTHQHGASPHNNSNRIAMHQTNQLNNTQDLYEAQNSTQIDAKQVQDDVVKQRQLGKEKTIPKIAIQNVPGVDSSCQVDDATTSTYTHKSDRKVISKQVTIGTQTDPDEIQGQDSPKDSLEGERAQAPELKQSRPIEKQGNQHRSASHQQSRNIKNIPAEDVAQEAANVEEMEQQENNRGNQLNNEERKYAQQQKTYQEVDDANYNATPRIDELRPEVPEFNVRLLTQKFNKDLKSPVNKNKVSMLRTNHSSSTRRSSYAHREGNSRDLRTTQSSFALPQPLQSLSGHARNRSHDDDISDTTSQMSTESSRISRLRQGWEEGAPKRDDEEDEGESKPNNANKTSISSLMEKFKQKGSISKSLKKEEEKEIEDSTKGVKQMALKMLKSSAPKPQRKSSVNSESIIGQMMARYEQK